MFPLVGLTKIVAYMEKIYAWLAKDENYSDTHILVHFSFTLTLVTAKGEAHNPGYRLHNKKFLSMQISNTKRPKR